MLEMLHSRRRRYSLALQMRLSRCSGLAAMGLLSFSCRKVERFLVQH